MQEPPWELFDAHCHLQDVRVPAHRMDELLRDAAAQGITHLAVNGCWDQDWERVAELARRYPATLLPQFGVHPWWLSRRAPSWLAQLRKMLLENPSAGVGECGIDRTSRCDAIPLQEQIDVFRSHLALAKELGRPVSVHCVRAPGAVLEALQAEGPFPETAPIVLHAFTGPADLVPAFGRFGSVYFSLGGILSRVSLARATAVARAVPLNRMLLETDAPDGQMKLGAALQELTGLRPGDLLHMDDMDATSRPLSARASLTSSLSGSGSPREASAEAHNATHHDDEPVCCAPRHVVTTTTSDAQQVSNHPRPGDPLHHPANLRNVLLLVAKLSGHTPEQIARATFANACRVWKLMR